MNNGPAAAEPRCGSACSARECAKKTFLTIFNSYGDSVGNGLQPNRKQMKGSTLTFSPMMHFHLLRWPFVVPSLNQPEPVAHVKPEYQFP